MAAEATVVVDAGKLAGVTKAALTIILSLLVAGCGSVSNHLLADSMCRKAAFAMDTIQVVYMAGRLSEDDAVRVDKLDTALRPLCTSLLRPTTEAGVQALSDTVTQLLLMQGKYGQ